ncbi:MAG: adenylate/guanylate cyclase domain-containing protein [Reyranella sp.]|nr:adenylate/guanylate cyclase domain-containing protein [Reyranella sp.]
MSDLRTLEEQPFPLRRRFRHRILPFLILFIAVLVGLTVYGARQATEAIYLDLALRRADTIARAVSSAAPAAWLDLMAGRATDSSELHKAFADEVHELKLIRLKVYDLRRQTIYDSVAEGIGKIEEGPALRAVIDRAGPSAISRVEPDGTSVYELYVPLLDDRGRVQAVFELYEPIDRLDGILARATAAPLIVPMVLMALLVTALWRLVSRAQDDIDARTQAMVALRRRIESFVSTRATQAARGTDDGGTIPSRRLVLSLLYSDVRAFTGFAEGNSPEAVVAFLNRLMTIQVRAVHDHGGDVDKLIGDALLAHFGGDDGAARAVAAARAILEACAGAGLPREVGIGVFTGEVVAGAIGPAERRDYTVVGDSVNVAARLCAAASGGELVVAAADLADGGDFAATETLYVKGRRDPLSVRRWRPSAGARLG